MSQTRTYRLGTAVLSAINNEIPPGDVATKGCQSVIVKVNGVQADVDVIVEMGDGTYSDIADGILAPEFGLESVA